MQNGIYKELLSLVGKDGERLVVINPDTDEGVVVMRLSEFERLTNKSQEITLTRNGDIESKITEKQPILAEKSPDNLSFWNNKKPSGSTVEIGQNSVDRRSLDNSDDSGRIHERKSATASAKDELKLIPASDEESAGDEYYFEPAEEVGL